MTLPALTEGGKPVRSGKWQIMINGESYKWIVAEAAKKALGMENIQERVFIVRLVNDKNDPNRVAGAAGFSVREDKLYIYRFKACLLACGGAVNVFRPRSVGEGMGRAWYPVWNAVSTHSMAAEAGAELTLMENRFVPARFKDGYGPVGAWFLLFKAKAMVKFVIDNKDWKPEMARTVDQLVEEIYRPVRTYLEHKDYTTTEDVNPHYITPKMFQFRLQKVMDEYVAGVSTFYQTNAAMLNIAERKLEMLRQDSLKIRAKDLHERLRAWENYHRVLTAYAHMKHIQFREESRYPGYYYRADFLDVDDENWKCFVNSSYNRDTGKRSLKKIQYVQLIKPADSEPKGISNPGSPV